jgi:hypothetical protein
MQNPDDFDEITEDVNFFVFLSEASKRVPDFLEIHAAQHKKEIWAWAEIIEVAKRSKEIRTNIPNEELASMFLNMSDGIVMKRTIGKEGGMDALDEIKRDWDNLYNLLKTSKK